jgi:hypothetical protein
MDQFSKRYKFSDWPNLEIPAVAAGTYAVSDADRLIYCGMSGREMEKAVASAKPKYGLFARLRTGLTRTAGLACARKSVMGFAVGRNAAGDPARVGR